MVGFEFSLDLELIHQKLPFIVVLQARLNLVGGAWCPSKSWSPKLDYLEVDLLDDYVVSSILIQGRYANDGLAKNEFATHIMLKFWRNGYIDFLEYRDEKGEVLLRANHNGYDVTERKLTNMIVLGSKIR